MDLNVFDEKSPVTEAVTKCLNGMSTAFNVPFMQVNLMQYYLI